MLRSWLLSTTALCPLLGLLVSAEPAHAADNYTKAPIADIALPAVDGFNTKFDAFGGSLAKRSLYGAEGVLSVPLAQRYGLQVEGAGGSLGGSGFGSVGGHLFWRDPRVGLLGAYASYTRWNAFGGVNLAKVGGEAAWYAGNWSLDGVAGVESGSRKIDISNGLTTTINLDTRAFDHITASYYATENFKLSAGHIYTGGRHALSLGTEFGFALNGGTMAAVFAEGRLGSASSNGVWGGLKVYFGQREKSLMRRHREDDPPTTTTNNLDGLANGTSSTPTILPVAPQGENGPV
jgi:hypothetical protein